MREWVKGKLGDLATIIMGQSPLGETCNTFQKGVPLLNGPTEFTDRFPCPVQFTTQITKIAQKNDILFCVRGSTTGRMNWADKNYVIGRGLAVIRHKSGDEYRFFLRGILDYHLNSLLSSATGSTFPNISREQLESLELDIPGLHEQKAIAAVLSSFDDKIDLLHRQNATLEAMAEALFRQWFVVEAKEEWKNGTLGDFALCVRDGVNPKEIQSNIAYVGLEHIDQKKIALSRYGDAQQVTSTKFKFRENDILFGKLRPYFHKVCFTPFSGVCSTDILVIRAKAENSFAFSLFAFFQNDVVEYANLGSKGTKMPRTDWETLSQYPFPMPDSQTLTRFDGFCKPLVEKIFSNQNQIQTLQKLRDTLLPKLMSGEVRVEC